MNIYSGKDLYFEAKYNFYIINLLKHKIVSYFAATDRFTVIVESTLNQN